MDAGEVSISAAAQIATLPPEEQAAAVESGDEEVVQKAKRVRRKRSAKNKAARQERKREQIPLPDGKYSCIVIDPPWPVTKIDRDVRPNQIDFDDPTMSEDDLLDFDLPLIAADNCHLYLWAPHKYIHFAYQLAEHWGFKCQCLMTWVKNIGFTPFSWMYDTEHVLFCRRGSLDLLKLGKQLGFKAKVREPSRKPDEFYDLVREVSPGPRIDVFSREKREGFDQWGNETGRF